jgi:hypothetical protein
MPEESHWAQYPPPQIAMTTPCSAPPWMPFPLGSLPAGGTVHLDRGYDYQVVRDELAARGLHARIAERGKLAPIQAGHRWVIERTHAWMNNYGKLIRCTERHKPAVEFYLALASAIVTLGRLIRQAWSCYRWQTRPRRRP